MYHEFVVTPFESDRPIIGNATAIRQVIIQMVQAGTDPDAINKHRLAALHMIGSTSRQADDEVIQVLAAAAHALVKAGADLNVRDPFDNTPLMRASSVENIPLIKTFLKLGADPNIPNKAGDTPLDYASVSRQPGLVELFLEHGADPDRCRKAGSAAPGL